MGIRVQGELLVRVSYNYATILSAESVLLSNSLCCCVSFSFKLDRELTRDFIMEGFLDKTGPNVCIIQINYVDFWKMIHTWQHSKDIFWKGEIKSESVFIKLMMVFELFFCKKNTS